ncbi:MAG: DUF1501 domain-containing protein [Verrucomicrobiales bacterium]|nr:DUF1501 domain-containing protein [Verrucomicrobiales bacterium]
MKRLLNSLDSPTRRQFIEKTAKAAFGVSLLPFTDQLLAENATTVGKPAKHIIYMFMSGRMTHLDTFDPKPGTPNGGSTTAIPTGVPGIELGEFLPNLAKNFKDIAVVRSMQQLSADHRGASYWMRTGYSRRATIIHPCLGAWGQRLLGPSHETLPSSVVVGGGGLHPGAGFLGPTFSPLPIGDPQGGLPNSTYAEGVDEKLFETRLDMMNAFNSSFDRKFQHDEVKAYNQFYDNALELMASEDLDVFDVAKEPEEKRSRYGNNRFGQGLLLAKRLISSGVRFVEVVNGGWDMHNELWNSIPQRAGETDQAIAALIEDLKAEGLFEETLLVLTTEFGRTPRINANGGRDHHSACFSAMLAGGPIVGGQVYGASDKEGHGPAENVCPQVDFNATIAKACGMPLDQVIYSPSGRPFLVAGHRKDVKTDEITLRGKPIDQFFS